MAHPGGPRRASRSRSGRAARPAPAPRRRGGRPSRRSSRSTRSRRGRAGRALPRAASRPAIERRRPVFADRIRFMTSARHSRRRAARLGRRARALLELGASASWTSIRCAGPLLGRVGRRVGEGWPVGPRRLGLRRAVVRRRDDVEAVSVARSAAWSGAVDLVSQVPGEMSCGAEADLGAVQKSAHRREPYPVDGAHACGNPAICGGVPQIRCLPMGDPRLLLD